MRQVAPLKASDPVRLGPYQLEGRLGTGGQGVVYLARDSANQRVAVKTLHADFATDPHAVTRFAKELAAAKRVAPFCTAQVLDSSADPEQPYIVSEYVDGPSLQQAVTQDGPRTGNALHRLAIATATALVAIHEANVVHRDLKPHNVLLGPDGARVIDFGISRALDTTMTTTNRPIGTPAYMAPEQIAGEQVGPSADIFAWAGIIVFAATGRPAFGQDSIPAVVTRIANAEPDLDGVAASLRELVDDCLAKDPLARPSARRLLDRLLDVSGSEPPARPAAVSNAGEPAVVPAESSQPPINPASPVDYASPAGAASSAVPARGAAGGLDRAGHFRVAASSATPAPGRPVAGNPQLADLGAETQPHRHDLAVPAGRRIPRRVLGVLAVPVVLVLAAFLIPGWIDSGASTRGGDRFAVNPEARTASDQPVPAAESPALSPSLVLDHGRRVWSVAVGQLNGKTVALTGSDGATVRVWDPVTGQLIRKISNNDTYVLSMTVGQLNGRSVALLGGRKTTQAWDLATGQLISKTGGLADVYSVVFGQLNGKTIAISGDEGGQVHTWDPVSGQQLGRFSVPDSVVAAAGDQRSGKSVVLSENFEQQSVRTWDPVTGQQLGTLAGAGEFGLSIAMKQVKGRLAVATGEESGVVKVWDLSTGKAIRQLVGHTKGVNSVAFGQLNGGTIVASGGSDKTIRLWEMATGKPLQKLVGHTDSVNSVAVGRMNDQAIAISGSEDHTARVWRLGPW